MSTTKNPAVRDTAANPATGFKTHSPEMYANSGSKVAKHFNLKVVDLLQMCFAANTGDKQQFLDIGCGTGEFTREELLPRCLPCDRVVATDASEDMLNFAKENFSHPKIVYDVLDIGGEVSSFVEKYGQFERVYSFLCLQWVKDKEAAMKNIRHLLVPGGECLLLFGVGGNTFKNFKYLAEIERWKPYKKVLDKFSAEIPGGGTRNGILNYYSDLLKRYDLVPYTCEMLYKSTELLDVNAMIKLQLSLNPIIPLLPEQEKAELSRDVSEIIRKHWDDDEDPISKYGVLMLVHAVRSME